MTRARSKRTPSPEEQLDTFLAKFLPSVAAEAVATLERLRRLVPGAIELVYDNYNALVIGFDATERPSEAVLSVAVFPRHVSLCFLKAAGLPDPEKLLQGSGQVAKHIRLASATDLDRPAIRALVAQAIEHSPQPFDTSAAARMIIRSVSAKQRPRRPAERGAVATGGRRQTPRARPR